MISTVRDDFLDAIFLAECFCGTDKLNLDVVFLRDTLGVLSNLFAQGFGEVCVVEDSDALPIEIQAHTIGMAPARNRAGDNNTVEAGETACYLFRIAIL